MHIVFARSSTLFDDSRATKEILALLEAGYNVTVLGWDRSGYALEKCVELFSNYNDQISLKMFSGTVGSGFIQKIVSRIAWNRWLKKEIINIPIIDVLHACDYDTGVAVRKIATSKKIKFVYDIYDYYIDAHPVPAVLKRVIENGENRIINDSEVTIICTEERRLQISKAHPKKVVVIYNSPDVDDFDECEEKYDYVYCGSLYDGRLINELLDEFHQYHHFKLIFAGYGVYEEKAIELAREYDTFDYLGSIPYSEVLNIEKESKVISAIYNPTLRNHQLCAPNKFYEALALGKPVIVCGGTGIDKIVLAENIGCVINYDVSEFYKALDYLTTHVEIRKEMGQRARKIYESEYRWSLMKKKLISEYELLK